MSKVIAVTNQKGGVGKTVTSVNLGIGLVREGYSVLMIDAFNEYGQKLPSIKELNNEIGRLMQDKKSLYREYYLKRDNNKNLQEAKRNVEMFLQIDAKDTDKKIEKSQPSR